VEEDDVGMSGANLKEIGLSEAVEFIWREADLLDRGAYREWLDLWTRDGRYIVPLDRTATDFDATLNYVNDDHAMRALRVQRLVDGQSVSATLAPRTVRTVSRFVTLAADRDFHELRCAQIVVVYRRDKTHVLAADVTYRLVAGGPHGLAIDRKIVSLINAEDALLCLSLLL
jgi:3-phenylpropionate/cinnamic acid dioxygenase small subunit